MRTACCRFGTIVLLFCASTLVAQEWSWRFIAGGATVGSGAFSDSGTYYFAAEDRFLYALDRNGVMIWRTDLGRPPAGAVAVGPDGTVYTTLDTGELIALNRDGRLVWRVDPFATEMYPPIVTGAGMVIVSDASGRVAGYNHRGVELWRVALEIPISAPPVAGFSRTILIATADAFLYELSLEGEILQRQFVNEEASVLISGSDRYYLGSASGRVLSIASDLLPVWRADVGSAIRELLVSGDGDLWATADDGTLSRVTAAGIVAWRADFSPATPGSAVISDTAIVPVSSGLLTHLDATGAVTRQLRLPAEPTAIVLSPSGTAIVTTAEWITYAFPLDALPNGPWAQARGSFTRSGLPVGTQLARGGPGRFSQSAAYLLLRARLLGRDASAQQIALSRVRTDIEEAGRLDGRYFAYLELLERVAGSPYFGPLSRSGPQSASRRAREEAIALLGTIGDLQTARFLARLLSYEPDSSLQATIMRAIGSVGSELDSRTVEYLAEVVRSNTINGPEDRVAIAVISLVQGLDEYQGRYVDPGIADVLIQIATANYSAEVRQLALTTLRNLAGGSEL